jgi:hypothetical protein
LPVEVKPLFRPDVLRPYLKAFSLTPEAEGAEQCIVALEGKGPRDPPDRPFAGRRMSAVDQGYRQECRL